MHEWNRMQAKKTTAFTKTKVHVLNFSWAHVEKNFFNSNYLDWEHRWNGDRTEFRTRRKRFTDRVIQRLHGITITPQTDFHFYHLTLGTKEPEAVLEAINHLLHHTSRNIKILFLFSLSSLLVSFFFFLFSSTHLCWWIVDSAKICEREIWLGNYFPFI